MKKYKILKIIDQFGWAYYFTVKEQQRYSQHKIDYMRLKDITDYSILKKYDLVYIPAPNISPKQIEKLCQKLEEYQIPTIGAYSGEVEDIYNYCNVVISISAPYLYKLRQRYKGKPVIYLPESIDTNFFKPSKKRKNKFVIGWAGGKCKAIKRFHLLDKLNFPYKIKNDHGQQFFKDNRKQKDMLDFYHSISGLVLLSTTECQPRVVMEAMACGLPVVATDVGSLRLIMDEQWLITVNPDKAMLKSMNSLLKILADYSKVRNKTGKINREKMVKEFSWEVNQPLWDKIFELTIQKNYKKIMSLAYRYEKRYKEQFDYYSSLHDTPLQLPKFKKSIVVQKPEKSKKKRFITKLNFNEPFPENLIKKLHYHNIPYVALEESCLNSIVYARQELYFNWFIIGTDKHNFQELNYFLQKLGYKKIEKDVYYLNNSYVKLLEHQTDKFKYMGLNQCQIKVPYPVLRYLRLRYGLQWRNLAEKLKKTEKNTKEKK